MQLIKEGAEARLYRKRQKGKTVLVKSRIAKSYRNKELDFFIRKQRTQREEKLLQTASRIGINVPSVSRKEEFVLEMDYIKGKTAKQEVKKNPGICFEIGKAIGKMHSNNLIHGDLTTSNILLQDKKLFFVDFGLGFQSSKTEDKAVDLLNLKKTFLATHSRIFEKSWKKIVDGYLVGNGNKQVFSQLEKVEKRARYKGGI